MITNIVWLDDDKQLMDEHEERFKKVGFNVIKCTTSTQAFKQILEGGQRNLLLDLEFPNSKRDGLLFLQQIQKSIDKLNVVILTGFPYLPEAIDLIKNGKVKDYIQKPIPDDPAGEQVFFYTLKKHFNEPEAVGRNDINLLLLKWRRPTWLLLISIIIITLILGIWLLKKHSWDINSTLVAVKNNFLATILVGVVWSLINSVLIKDLYDKYKNHSNIANYLKRKAEEKNR